MAKKRETNKELPDLENLIDSIDETKKPFAKKLYKRAEFMERTLINLEETISKDGAIICAINGNGFETTSEHPAQKSYNVMIGRYNAVIKTLIDLIPSGVAENDELMDFLKKKR